MLPSEVPRLATDPLVRVFPGVWKLLSFLRLPSVGQGNPWRRKWQPTALFLLGESHGQRSLVGYSPQGHKELDTTARLHFPKMNLHPYLFVSVFSFIFCPTSFQKQWVAFLGA